MGLRTREDLVEEDRLLRRQAWHPAFASHR